jgi:hypothetical protein
MLAPAVLFLPLGESRSPPSSPSYEAGDGSVGSAAVAGQFAVAEERVEDATARTWDAALDS